MNAVKPLDLAEAQAWFDALPVPLRVRSLSPDFGAADVHREAGLTCVHLGYAEGPHRWLHTTHLRGAGTALAAISPYGYGGPLGTTDEAGFAARAWAAYQAWACEARVLGEFCRFHPQADHARFFGGEVLFNRQTVSVDLTPDDVTAQYNTLARRKIRKTQDCRVRWSRDAADWRAYGPFYRAAMAAMGAQARYHFADGYFEALSALEGAELCIVGEGERWLSAGVYLFQQGAGPGTLEYHLGASSAEGHERGTAYLLQHAAALEGRRRGLAHLYLGAGTTPEPDNPLYFYKRCFSRRELPFHIGRAVHDAAGYREFVHSKGYELHTAPANVLFE
jgi:hypothetical protein